MGECKVRTKLYIWGTGDDAKKLMERNPIMNVFVEKFIDTNEMRWGMEFCHRNIVSPLEVERNDKICIIIATSRYYEEIAKNLEESGFFNYLGLTNMTNWENSIWGNEVAERIFQLKKVLRNSPWIVKKMVIEPELVLNWVFNLDNSIKELLENYTEIYYWSLKDVFFVPGWCIPEYCTEIAVYQVDRLIAYRDIGNMNAFLGGYYVDRIDTFLLDDDLRIKYIRKDTIVKFEVGIKALEWSWEYILSDYEVGVNEDWVYAVGEEVSFVTDTSVHDFDKKFSEIYKVVFFEETKNIIVCTHDWLQRVGQLENDGYCAIPFWLYYVMNENVISFKKMKMISEVANICISEMMTFIYHKQKKTKKLILFWGNCQTIIYRFLLLSNKELCNKFVLIDVPAIQEIGEAKIDFDECFWKCIDVLVYQHIDSTNKFGEKLATDIILTWLRREAISVCIPNVYFTGYFPQIGGRPICVGNKTIFPLEDKNINEMKNRYSTKEIARCLLDTEFYSKEECERNVKESLGELKKRELSCGVIISDYIESNYKLRKLFYTHNHPTSEVLAEVLRRVFYLICSENYHFDLDERFENDNWQMFIYPSVKKQLQLQFDSGIERYIYCRMVKKEPSNMEEYIEDYIKYSEKRT